MPNALEGHFIFVKKIKIAIEYLSNTGVTTFGDCLCTDNRGVFRIPMSTKQLILEHMQLHMFRKENV